MPRSLLILGYCLFLPLAGIRAQPAATYKKRLADLLVQYQQHRINDTTYLRAADSAASLLLSEDSLTQLLSTYRQVAFSNSKPGKYRANYYTYLAINSYNRNKFGSAIYYAERNNEEKVNAGLFEKGGIPHSDLFAITLYCNNRDYTRVFAKYDTLRPVLLKMPDSIPPGKVSDQQAFVAISILDAVVYAACKTGDITLADEGTMICKKMLDNIRKQPAKYKDDLTFYSYVYHTMLFYKAKYEKRFRESGDYLYAAMREVRSADFPSRLQAAYEEELYTDAFDLYFDNKKTDSAQHYLTLVRNMHDSLVKFSTMRQSFLLEGASKLQAAGGHFEAAYADLLRLYQMSDSAYYAVSSDRDNNLYALAKEENTRNELMRSEVRKRKAEQSNIALFLLLVLVAGGGSAGFVLYRSRQKRRLLNLQLNLARNFHDEIGPMLLYANIMARKQAETHPTSGLEELNSQLAFIMEAVRGISHDLKSGKLSTVNSFYKDVTTLLEKIKAATQIDFKARIQNGGRVLSQLQYANLWTIINELISNSIKHAGCSLITFNIRASEQDLRIKYSDNGKGIAHELQVRGIGMQNMRERANLLRGEFKLNNAYPEGYSIIISIPLV